MSTELDARLVAERISTLRQHLAAIAPENSVGIVAVTKGFGVDAPRAALAAGLTMVGENYAQELIAKHEELTPEEREQIQWHFLGRLQRNKVRSLAPIVSVWQSVDRVELIEEIARRSAGASVMIQLNISGESQKGGAALGDCESLVRSAQGNGLVVVGLMGVGAAEDESTSRDGFRRLVQLADELGLPERSIGMSDDLDLAVTEGSTMVRVGTALFGSRGPRSAG